jgi:hypothetical protein
MPSTSKAQQRLMGMAYALKKGDVDPKDASQEVKDLADGMTLQQLKDFAETKHDGLPDHADEAKVNEWLPGVSAGHKWYTQQAQSAISYGSNAKDRRDNLIQSFIEFIETGKKPKKITNAKITEDVGGAPAAGGFSAPQASPTNTPGMGNVSAPGPGIIGSGDKFGEDDEDEVKNQHGIVSYEQFKKKFLTSGKSNKQ